MLDTFSISSEMARAAAPKKLTGAGSISHRQTEVETQLNSNSEIVKRNSLNDFVKSLKANTVWCRSLLFLSRLALITDCCHVRAEWQLNGLRIVKSFMINSLQLPVLEDLVPLRIVKDICLTFRIVSESVSVSSPKN